MFGKSRSAFFHFDSVVLVVPSCDPVDAAADLVVEGKYGSLGE